MIDLGFFLASMPDSRPADYYLGCLDGSVFLDFNDYEGGRICLIRISFDGYGCCNLGDEAVPLNREDSVIFKDLVQCQIIDKDLIGTIIKKAISLNEAFIWADALQDYHLT